MPTGLVDANIILRYLTNDPPEMSDLATALFDAVAEGRESVWLEDAVLAEVVWTLRSSYRADLRDIADRLLDLVADDHVLNHDSSTLMAALTLYKEFNIGFADAILVA
ncbi:MAG: PIN domain-containing protein [Thermomicrobiales bacterium]|nr:PIN domain-containing protein [Thermomicrobiales bacterium]